MRPAAGFDFGKMDELKAEQFSLRRMLTSVTVIAAGLALLTYFPHHATHFGHDLLACAAGGCMGWGIGILFRKPAWGAAIGFALVAVIVIASMPPAIRD